MIATIRKVMMMMTMVIMLANWMTWTAMMARKVMKMMVWLVMMRLVTVLTNDHLDCVDRHGGEPKPRVDAVEVGDRVRCAVLVLPLLVTKMLRTMTMMIVASAKKNNLMIVEGRHETENNARQSEQVEHCVEKLGGETISIIAGTEKSFRS